MCGVCHALELVAHTCPLIRLIRERSSEMPETTAVEMAKKAGIDPKRFRQALRNENLPGHQHNEKWTVEIGKERHADMKKVLEKISR